MTRRYELIVFDWDGTLMDSAGAIARAIQASARDLGLPEPSELRARHVIGLGLQEALAYAVPELHPSAYPDMIERYRHHYLSSDHELQLFPGSLELIEALAGEGWLLGVATGKSRKGLDRALASSGLDRFFRTTRCADECFSKPHPQMLEELMMEFGVKPSGTLMIGDTTHDLGMARNAGVDAVAVEFGAHPREVLLEFAPLEVVDSTAALSAWLRANA
jgi:phosphoglycolate phosphatase